MSKPQCWRGAASLGHCGLVICWALVTGHWSFTIRHEAMKWQGILRLAACFSVLATAAAEPPPYVWLEGEKPASANFQFTPQTHALQVFSAGESLFHAVPKEELGKVPAEGLLLAYDFTATADGEYQFWARVGFEWVRARMAWRVDGGEWRTYAETELTTSLMKVAVWQELGWGKCGAVRLTKGPHRLDVRFTQPPGNDRFLFGLDCLAFVQAEFVPEGRLKPGETYTAEADRAAAAHVFTFPPGKPQDAAVRVELPLSGPWQVARYDDLNMDAEPYAPVRELPASYPWRWMGISAPGDAWKQRPELPFAHRLVYQTRVRIPRELAGRSFVLHFAGTCYIVSVFINGQFCDSRQSVLVPWDCDITRLVKPGQNNLVQVAIKSGYYCLDLPPDKSGQKPSIHAGRNIPEGFHRHRRWADAVHPSSKGEGDGLQVGLVNPVSLVAAGPAYTSDVFVRTSVARKRLDATVELTNASSRETEVEVRCEAVHDRTGTVEKSFAPVQVKVAAGGKATVEIAGDWPDAKLWWPSEHVNDLPDCYRLRTTLLAGGAPLDRREDLFGFREITIQGRHFLLNGVRWRFYNWVDVPDRKSIKGSTDWFQRYHAQNDGFHRFSHDHSSIFGCREKAIDVLDRLGVPSRCSMCIDGMFITQELLNPLTWQNWERHVQQVVKAYRNHPSIMHWSVGNEVMLVNAHNVRRKDYVELEKKMLRLLQVAKELDPTRDSYEDGAGDLGGLGSINCVHYSWQWYDDVPRQLYQYPTGPAFQARPGERSETYLWDGNRPLIGGEEFYYANRPFNVAWIGGPDVYRSPERSHLAASRYVRMALEGARWQDAAGMCPWTEVLPGAEKALARRAVFVREHTQCFAPGATLTRTLKVFNDTRRPETLTLRWRVAFGGKDAASGEKSYTLAAGMNQEDTISAKLPDAKTRA
ncbi:MAG: hypothetical protein FJ278_06415, partial [Planctomycetes bacterium]|nr:hypothetical protein [Planctomycetota bacterium]